MMAYRSRAGLLAIAVAIAACASDGASVSGAPVAEKTAKRAQALSTADIFGTSLPAKTIALTFDDGPGGSTVEMSTYLKAQGIRAAFFVNGARIAPTTLPSAIGPVAGAVATLAQLVADGHLVANHSTTHRSLTGLSMTPAVAVGERVQELSDTDTAILAYVPSGRFLFRAAFGDWDANVQATLAASPMNKYVGPINWEVGGDADGYPGRAADWACWSGALRDTNNQLVNGTGTVTAAQCGDAYLAELATKGNKGIILAHESSGAGLTVAMIKHIVPILKAGGYTFVRVDEVPAIAAALPPCHATCATCSGASANQCTTCAAGKTLTNGTCTTTEVDAAAPDSGGATSSGTSGENTSSGASGASGSSGESSSGSSGESSTSGGPNDGAAAPNGEASSGGCSAGPRTDGSRSALGLGVVGALAMLSRRRRRAAFQK